MRNMPHWFRRRQDPLPKRLFELHMLLRTVCMVRRTKADVLTELPPKIRRIIELHRDDSLSDYSPSRAEAAVARDGMSSQQICGLQKVGRRDFHEMLEMIVSRVMAEKGQLIVFAHHHRVMDHLYAQLGHMGTDRCVGVSSNKHCFTLESRVYPAQQSTLMYIVNLCKQEQA